MSTILELSKLGHIQELLRSRRSIRSHGRVFLFKVGMLVMNITVVFSNIILKPNEAPAIIITIRTFIQGLI